MAISRCSKVCMGTQLMEKKINQLLFVTSLQFKYTTGSTSSMSANFNLMTKTTCDASHTDNIQI